MSNHSRERGPCFDREREEMNPKIKSNEKKNNWKGNRELLIYLFILIKQNKKWWLVPLLLVLAFLGLFVSLTGNQSILPAIYALF
jgi:hypothetical protein